MELTNKEGVRLIVNALAELGLRHVVICPGSRNAPFVISFNRHAAFKCYSIRDERSAGFFALGLAKETQLPVAILCTSGSATVNFAQLSQRLIIKEFLLLSLQPIVLKYGLIKVMGRRYGNKGYIIIISAKVMF
jgi:2-succinyl-5-enolpyruvyl-6-hydroxy-3-cyclohexene-1-carboxylate synthase